MTQDVKVLVTILKETLQLMDNLNDQLGADARIPRLLDRAARRYELTFAEYIELEPGMELLMQDEQVFQNIASNYEQGGELVRKHYQLDWAKLNGKQRDDLRAISLATMCELLVSEKDPQSTINMALHTMYNMGRLHEFHKYFIQRIG